MPRSSCTRPSAPRPRRSATSRTGPGVWQGDGCTGTSRTRPLCCAPAAGSTTSQHPFPDQESWKAIPDPEQRLRAALVRDVRLLRRHGGPCSPTRSVTRATSPVMAPFHEHWRRAADTLSVGWGARGTQLAKLRAAIAVALSFQTWAHARPRAGPGPRGRGGRGSPAGRALDELRVVARRAPAE